ncbi:hypothetical protein [Burkholderia sp. A2]|uniref:hypothetical protein n=1 Tax=Burkholderia sp. A2 TaxID=236253 RepID=UPI00084C7BCC|nr:hypothetical protein [Burkholderia sp. A2]OED13102.1 hypothetical protein A9Z05_23200 [Burkholderia sp. A2]
MYVIAMTAHAMDEARRNWERVGAAEVVLKPLSIETRGAVLSGPTLGQSPVALASGDADTLRIELHSMRGAALG